MPTHLQAGEHISWTPAWTASDQPLPNAADATSQSQGKHQRRFLVCGPCAMASKRLNRMGRPPKWAHEGKYGGAELTLGQMCLPQKPPPYFKQPSTVAAPTRPRMSNGPKMKQSLWALVRATVARTKASSFCILCSWGGS